MRIYYYLTILTILLAGASGYLLWQTYHPVFGTSQTFSADITQIKNEFLSQTKPVFDLPLEDYLQGRKSKTLSDPKTALVHIADYPFAEISALSHYADTCNNNLKINIQSDDLKKALLWQQFLCGKTPYLPDNFFVTGTLIHPSGVSYVRLAELSERAEFLNPAWQKAHLSELHLLEILNNDETRNTGLQLSAWDLENMLNGEDIILKPDHVLFASRSAGPDKLTTKYKVFHRDDWDRFIHAKAIMANTRIDSPFCLSHEGNICWMENKAKQTSHTRVATSLLFFGFILLALGLIHTAIKRRRTEKQDASQRLFTLQMLTHELRTPATALRLAAEAQRADFDSLSMSSQKAFLQICDELQRLDRVIDASKNYLKSQDSSSLLNASTQTVTSINDLVKDIVEPYLHCMNYHPLPADKHLRLDRYWIELCIKNLIENALIHGKPPVSVSLMADENSVVISVIDHGTSAFTSLHEMTLPFQKDHHSHGLGLGLAIVQKVVLAMHGELLFKSAPTKFSIKLRH